MANGDNENQNQDQGFWQGIKDSLLKQKEETQEMSDNLKESMNQSVNKQELLSALEEMKEELDKDQDEESFAEISRSIQQLKAFQEESLTPEMYRDVVGDLFEDFNESQSSVLRDILSEVGGLNEAMSSGFSRISGVLSDAFAPLMELKELGLGVFETLKGGFDKFRSLFGMLGSNKEETEQTSLLGSIKNYMSSLVNTQQEQLDLDERQYKKSLRKDTTDKEGGLFGGGMGEMFATIISGALVTLGGAIGASIRSITLPFEVIGKAVNKFIPLATWFSGIIDSVIGVVSKMPAGTKLLGYFQKMFQSVTSLINVAKSSTGILGSLVSGLRFGFKVLGWPLTILMGFIDFVRGFTSEQGTLIDKIKSGLTEAIQGFVKLPVQLIGWISDWILGLVGVKIKGGAAESIMSGIEKTVNFAVETILFPFKVIYKGLYALTQLTINVGQLLNVFDLIKTVSKAAFDAIIFPFKTMWNSLQLLWNLFTGDIKGASTQFKQILGDVGNLTSSLFNVITWPYKQVYNAISWLFTSITGIQTPEFPSLGEVIKGTFNIIVWPFKQVYNTISWLSSAISNIPIPELPSIGSLIESALSIITWPFKQVYSSVSWLASTISGISIPQLPSIGQLVESALNWINYPFQKIQDSINWLVSSISELGVSNIFNAILEKLKSIPGLVKDWISSLIPGKEFFSNIGSSISSWFGGGEESKGKSDGGESKIPRRAMGAAGGYIAEGGLARIHKGEQLIPKSTVDKINNIEQISYDTQRIERERQVRDSERTVGELRKLQSLLSNMDRGTQQETGTPKVESEPPDEIESLSLLIFNKQWGIA